MHECYEGAADTPSESESESEDGVAVARAESPWDDCFTLLHYSLIGILQGDAEQLSERVDGPDFGSPTELMTMLMAADMRLAGDTGPLPVRDWTGPIARCLPCWCDSYPIWLP